MSKQKKRNSKIISTQKPKPQEVTKKLERSAYKVPSFFSFLKSYWKENLIILMASIAIYAQTHTYGYVLDDAIVITENDYTKQGFAGIPTIFSTESFQGYFKEQKDLVVGGRYRPLSIATFAAEKSIFGISSAVGHMINMLLYAICCMVLLRFLTLLFYKRKKEVWYFSFVFIAALLFTLHPLHTEAVANVKGRDEILVLLFSLISGIFCIKAMYRRCGLNLVLGAVMLFIGLLAKENAVTFLAIIPMSQYFFTNGSWKKIGSTILTLLIPIIAYLTIRYQVIGYFLDSGTVMNDVMNNPFVGMSGGQTYATIFYTLFEYLKLAFFPHPLTHDYYPYHIPISEWGDVKVILSLIIHGILGLVALILLPKKHVVSYCIIFYLAALSVVSNLFFTVGTFMNERFLFISTIGICIFLAYVIKDLIPKYFTKVSYPLGLSLLVVFVIGFSYKSITRVPAWESPYTLNSTAVAVSKNSARVNTFMCTALFEKAKITSDRKEKMSILQQADIYARRSVDILPDYHNGNKMKAGVAAEIYKIDRKLEPLLNCFKEVLIANPKISFIYEYLDYLNGFIKDQQTLFNFYHEVGFLELSKKQNKHDWALKVLDYGYKLDQKNKLINTDMSAIYNLLGNVDKSYHHAKMAGNTK